MIEKYKLFENVQKAKKILRDNKLPENDERYLKLKEILKDNLGYLGEFTRWLIEDRESLDLLQDVYFRLRSFNNFDRTLDSFGKLEDLYDYLQSYNVKLRTNKVINALPSRTKELVTDRLRRLIDRQTDTVVLDLIRKHYHTKGGRYHTSDLLYKGTEVKIKNVTGDFNLPNILKKIDGFNVEIVSKSDDLLMVRVDDFDASKNIGSADWCIVTHEHYWNSHVGVYGAQYFIWDFTKDISDIAHLMGTTINQDGEIIYAHWANDDPITDRTYFDTL